MIIAGYQGIGKSTYAAKYPKCIDLESSSFFIDGVRPKDWHVLYCNVAMNLSQQGYFVFISSHKVVRDYLAENAREEDLILIFPSVSLKDQWLQKLKARYDETGAAKDYRAWKNAEECYECSIKELRDQRGFACLALTDINYNLGDYLNCISEVKRNYDET